MRSLSTSFLLLFFLAITASLKQAAEADLLAPKTKEAHHSFSENPPARKLPLLNPAFGASMPMFNPYYTPGIGPDPLLYSSPFFPRYGSQAMLPPPYAMFHYGNLPIQSIYDLHYPTVFTPQSLYGLPHVYNPMFAMNLPYSYLHHPYAAQLINNLAYMNQGVGYSGYPQQMGIQNPFFGTGAFPGGIGYSGQPGAFGPAGNLGPQNFGAYQRKLEKLEKLEEQSLLEISVNKRNLKRFLKSQEKHFAKTIAKELEDFQKTIKNPEAI